MNGLGKATLEVAPRSNQDGPQLRHQQDLLRRINQREGAPRRQDPQARAAGEGAGGRPPYCTIGQILRRV